MAVSQFLKPHRVERSNAVTQILEAADELVRNNAFHLTTMEEIGRRAGVSRATVFTRFGSKLGILEALNVRCSGGPEIAALIAALRVEDPVAALLQLIDASCDAWERLGYLTEQLKAIVLLEPHASALIAGQQEFRRSSLEGLCQRLSSAELLAQDQTVATARAALMMLTSLEAFLELRREGAQSLDATKAAIRNLATPLLTGSAASVVRSRSM